MYKIELIKNGNEFSYITKNENGQILHLEFFVEQDQKHDFYFVEFYIGKRKNGFQHMKTTGKDGLKSLIWAKNCIKDFIKYLENKKYYFESDKELKHTIVIMWSDNRRRNTYYRGLKSLRFYYGMYKGSKCLMYNIKKIKK